VGVRLPLEIRTVSRGRSPFYSKDVVGSPSAGTSWKMSNFMIYFTKHAEEKFDILKRHKFSISKEQVIETIKNPEGIDRSRLPLLIAQKKFDKTHVLRVVYKQEEGLIKVITFYPGRRKQYEK